MGEIYRTVRPNKYVRCKQYLGFQSPENIGRTQLGNRYQIHLPWCPSCCCSQSARGVASCSIIPACGKGNPLSYRLGSLAITTNEKKARSLRIRISMGSRVRVSMASVVNGAKRICWTQKSLMKFSITRYSRNCIHT